MISGHVDAVPAFRNHISCSSGYWGIGIADRSLQSTRIIMTELLLSADKPTRGFARVPSKGAFNPHSLVRSP